MAEFYALMRGVLFLELVTVLSKLEIYLTTWSLQRLLLAISW